MSKIKSLILHKISCNSYVHVILYVCKDYVVYFNQSNFKKFSGIRIRCSDISRMKTKERYSFLQRYQREGECMNSIGLYENQNDFIMLPGDYESTPGNGRWKTDRPVDQIPWWKQKGGIKSYEWTDVDSLKKHWHRYVLYYFL